MALNPQTGNIMVCLSPSWEDCQVTILDPVLSGPALLRKLRQSVELLTQIIFIVIAEINVCYCVL